MNSYNKKTRKISKTSLLNEAEKQASTNAQGISRYMVLSHAVKRVNNLKGKACTELLEKEIINSLADPNFWKIGEKLS